MPPRQRVDADLLHKLLALRDRIVPVFNPGRWDELGLLTGCTDIIDGHDRLLRSWRFGDEDYEGNVLSVLKSIVDDDPANLQRITDFVDRVAPLEGEYVSSQPSARRILFAPSVFQIPNAQVERDLASVMMPFDKAFSPVYDAIKAACGATDLRCLRADDIWEHATIIQDIFGLIFRSHVVVVDFTGKNPNVMYETGIAHTLGKQVVPITQSIVDVPFDMRHHRVLKYHPNGEGLAALTAGLTEKLKQFAPPMPPPPTPSPPEPKPPAMDDFWNSSDDPPGGGPDDDIPF